MTTRSRSSTSKTLGAEPSRRTRVRAAIASAVIGRRVASSPSLRTAIEEHKLSSRIAEMILAERTRAGLTQKGLADRVGTTQSVISRLEDADYGGHSLAMLQRIAEALGLRLEVSWTRVRA